MFLLNWSVFPWDFAILLLITLSLCILVLSALKVRRDRYASRLRRYPVMALAIASFLGLVTTLYGAFVEPQIIVTSTYEVELPLRYPLTIAVISDLHVGPYKGASFVQKAVERVNRTLPDLVFITGDFLFAQDSSPNALAPLANLQPSIGTFAVLGNHDMGRYRTLLGKEYVATDRTVELASTLQDLGVTILYNEHRTLPFHGENLAIAGIEDLWSEKADLGATLKDIPGDVPVILLSHNPDVMLDARSKRASLIVASHTHGGQFRLPFLGPIAPLPTNIGRKYDQGIFKLTPRTTLAITRGLGEALARARLFAWPEVMVLKTTN